MSLSPHCQISLVAIFGEGTDVAVKIADETEGQVGGPSYCLEPGANNSQWLTLGKRFIVIACFIFAVRERERERERESCLLYTSDAADER